MKERNSTARSISGMIFAFVLLLIASQTCGMAIENDAVAKSTRFTLDFYRAAFNREANAVMSPVSIQSTLALLYHVANQETAQDMQRVLGMPAQASEEMIPILKSLVRRAHSNELKMVSKVYHSQAELNPQVSLVLRGSYDVELEAVDFNQKQQVADSANAWVDRSTNGMIKDLIKPDEIEDNEQLILLNAITLDAKWNLPLERLPWKMTFHYVNGPREIDMMTEMDYFPYAEVNGLKVLEMPYEDGTDLSMMLIMPTRKPLEELIKRFDLAMYQKLDGAMQVSKGDVVIPKFSINTKVPAKEILQSMGLSSAFDVGAFNVFLAEGAQVSDLRQKAVINVFEGGTTAAAVSEGRIVLLSGPSYEFRADRPFLYLIRRSSTKEIFFIGHYSHYES